MASLTQNVACSRFPPPTPYAKQQPEISVAAMRAAATTIVCGT